MLHYCYIMALNKLFEREESLTLTSILYCCEEASRNGRKLNPSTHAGCLTVMGCYGSMGVMLFLVIICMRISLSLVLRAACC